MRLGAYPAVLEPDSIVAQAYGATEVSERHRHRYEVNNAYRDRIAESGLRFSGTSPDGHLVEFVEYPPDVHPFLVGTQAHPELKSRPTRPHPLFAAFIGAAMDYKAAERLPVEIPEHARQRQPSTRRASDASLPASPNRHPWLSTSSRRLSSETAAYAERSSRCAATRCAMPGGNTARARSSSTSARSPSSRWTTTATSPLVYQYRHALGRRLWELPAGLLDVGGEPPHLTAARELVEEAGLPARPGRCWSTSIPRPGSATRSVRVYLATGLTEVGRPEAHDEEADLTLQLVSARRGGPRWCSAARSSMPLRWPGFWPPTRVDRRLRRSCGRSTRRGSTGRRRSPRGRTSAVTDAPARRSMTQLQGYLDHLTIERGVAANTLELLPARPAPLPRAPDGPRHRRPGQGRRERRQRVPGGAAPRRSRHRACRRCRRCRRRAR